MKTAFIFPGQGAQYVGMGKEFYDTFEVSHKVFETASEVTGLDIPALCFEENEQINITEYTQIAMLTMEIAVLKAVEEKGIVSQVHAGLSLGEYGALVASGVLSMEDAFRVVRKRGILMQEAVPQGGAMTAILGLNGDQIEEALKQVDGIVSVANYNCPGQIVITGEEKAVEAGAECCKAVGAKRCIPLKVSGPFHSRLLERAGSELRIFLDTIEIHPIQTPYITNVTADYVTNQDQVKDLLAAQVSFSVRWQQTMEKMIADGVDRFIEIGPGKTLSGFLKKIDRSKQVLHVETVKDLEEL